MRFRSAQCLGLRLVRIDDGCFGYLGRDASWYVDGVDRIGSCGGVVYVEAAEVY